MQQQFSFLKESELHVFGTAGVGKTHLACHICEQRLENELPALYVRGARFRSDDSLEAQLRNLFDIPPSYAWGDFVEALATVAEVYETKIPIVIDGLNEAVRHGRFSTVWETDLPGIAADLSRVGRLALLTTCRPTYRAAIWKTVGPNNHFTLTGFDDDIAEQAIAKYFEWCKITADTTLASLSPFRFPIYLRLFCEITNPSRETEVEAYVGQQSLFEVFRSVYISFKRGSITKPRKHQLPPWRSVPSRTLLSICGTINSDSCRWTKLSTSLMANHYQTSISRVR